MCLIALAHAASDRYPLVLAANRDEDHERPTRAAHFWDDAPHVLGGRDLRAGGGWLALTRDGRFAAVTNLRFAAAPPTARSRGELVGGFVRSDLTPRAYVESIDRDAYAGFHFLAGAIGGEIAYVATGAAPVAWQTSLFGVSNAPPDERWPKVDAAVERVRAAMALDVDALVDDLLAFLASGPPADYTASPFILGDRYGTRSSTVIVATREEIVFVEQNWLRGGVRAGEPLRFTI